MSEPDSYDIAIVGGGMVGATLAVALAPLKLRMALIEAVPHHAAAQPSFDERTTALSNGSRRILETIGVWPQLDASASAIRKIHVSDQGRFGFARIDAAEQGLAAMGYVAPNRALGDALWTRLPAEGMRVFCPAEVAQVESNTDAVLIEVRQGGVEATIRAKLVVAADGVNSAVRRAFGVDAQVRDYEQTAVITTILPQRFHEHVAYERFTSQGPLALLPLEGGRCTLVLTLSPQAAKDALQWSDAEFIAEVQRRFGFRLGRFLKVGRRVPYPLALSRAERTSEGRCVIIGNAAQGLHPVAGMGFNLGLRDVASLAELLADHADDPDFDAGGAQLLATYDAWRAADRGGVIAFTDGLVRLFSNPLRGVQRLRNLGLLAFDLLPPAKAALSRLSTGANGRVPKLARGVGLSPRSAP
ncbi:MAG: 2-octaprenyl-6-methoxyphenol hydroxylase [Gammaproteobacteria bacterium]|jgi:2-octaprenyl-6-methoxyphenol hydroxylase|nr:2-octaprenyl-6-methoxyphenol hydroxylase [Gammaproteobacteria bacterium]